MPRNAPSKGKSNFTKAAALVQEDEDQIEDEIPDKPAPTKSEPKVKEAKKSKKEQKREESEMLLAGERAARNRRIKNRFIGALGIGFILEMIQSKNADSASQGKKNSGKKIKKQFEDDHGFMKKAESFAGPFMVLALLVGIIGLKVGEDTWTPSHDDGTDYYGVMGVPRDASLLDIKKAYKKLALQWHPDKHPDCEICPDRFAKISEASEVLSDPERRQAYDTKSKAKNKLTTANSVDLTADDFQAKVLRSNEVWIILIYDPSSEACGHFHPVWEDVSTKEAKSARFGRINLAAHRRVMDLLPQRVMYTPAVFKFGRGMHPENFVSDRNDEGTAGLVKFVQSAVPPLPILQSAPQVTSWEHENNLRVLLAGPQTEKMRGKRRQDFQAAAHTAFSWGEFFDVKVVDGNLAREALGTDLVPMNSDKTWSILVAGSKGSKIKSVEAKDTSDLADLLKANLEESVTDLAPYLTVRNFRQLCAGHEDDIKNYCLFFVDMPDDDVARLTKEIAQSKQAYAQELADLKESADDSADVTEENFRLQPVRIRTSASHFPWVPDCPDFAKFTRGLWDHTGRSSMFVLEWDTRRYSPLKGKSLIEVFQSIAYEDVQFQELPDEGPNLMTILPDPESSLSGELRRGLTSVVGAALALLFLAGAVALFPELPVPVSALAVGVIFAVLMFCWPAACRRVFGKFLMMH